MPPTLPCLVLLAASLCVGGLSRAMAQGPSALRRVLEAVRAQPDLIRQTNVELPRRDLKAAGIICRAALHGEDWQLMGGGRAPIPTQQRRSQFAHRCRAHLVRCPRAQARVHRLGQLSRAPDNFLHQRAKYSREANIHWSRDP